MGMGEIRPAQDIHRCTGTLLFARANSKNAALIFANNPGGTNPYANTSLRPGMGDRPALGHSSTLYSETTIQLRSSSRPIASHTWAESRWQRYRPEAVRV